MISGKRQPKGTAGSDSWEALADRFETIASAVSATASAVAKKDGELTVMRRELETRIGNLETHVTAALQELRAAEVAASTKKTGAGSPPRPRDDGKVVLLKEEVASLSAQLNAMAATVQTASAGVASHERKLEALGQRPETTGESSSTEVEQRIQDVIRTTTAVAQLVNAQEAEIATVKSAVTTSSDALGQRVAELGQTIAELAVRVDDSKTETSRGTPLDDALGKRLDNLVEAVTSAAKRLDAQQVEIATIATNSAAPSDALELRVEELGQTIAELAVRVDDSKTETSRGTPLDDALGKRIDNLVEAVTSAAKRLDAQQVEIATIAANSAAPSDALELRVEELGQMVTGLVLQIQDLARPAETMARDTKLDDALEKRLDDVVEALTSAAERLDAQQVETSTLRTALATSNGVVEQRVEQLWQTVAGLAAQGDDLARLDAAMARSADLDGVLEQRLDEIVRAMTSTSERVEGQQAEIAKMMATLSAPSDAVESRVEELGQIVATLAADVHGLDQREQSLATSNLDERLAEMSDAIDGMGAVIDGVVSRVDGISANVDNSLAALGDSEVGLAELDRHFTEAGARFETIIGELRDLIRILPASASQGGGEVVSQLDELRADAAATAERIERLESKPSVSIDNPAAVEHLEHELAALRLRLQSFAMPEEIVSQLDALRLSTSTVAVRIERIEDLASRTAENASSSASRIGADLAALARRIEQFERREDELLAEIERAQALWPVALRSLEARLDDIVAKQDDLGPADANGGSLVAALHASLAAMQAVAAETPETTDLPSSDSPPDRGRRTAAPKARVRRTKA